MFSLLSDFFLRLTHPMYRSRKRTRHFSSRPLNTTERVSIDAFKKQSTQGFSYQIQNDTEQQPTVGNLKESLRQVISISLFLSTSWMKANAVSLKAKMNTLGQKGEGCMQQISHVSSKAKGYMLQTISTI